MTELAKDVAAIDVTNLLTQYSFDLNGAKLDRLVDAWLSHYPTQWVRLAVIEALFQGRYKAISVEQILNLWQRRGRSLYRFNHEFERVICGRFPSSHYLSSPSQFSTAARRRKPLAPSSSSPVQATPPQEPLQERHSPSPALPKVEPEPIAEAEASSPADSIAEPTGHFEPETTGTSVTPLPSFQESIAIPQPDDSELEPLVALSADRSINHRQPIHQFIPSPEASDFYAKLRAVAQSVAVEERE